MTMKPRRNLQRFLIPQFTLLNPFQTDKPKKDKKPKGEKPKKDKKPKGEKKPKKDKKPKGEKPKKTKKPKMKKSKSGKKMRMSMLGFPHRSIENNAGVVIGKYNLSSLIATLF